MKRGAFVTVLGLLIAAAANCQEPSAGDIWRWIPFDGGPTGKDAEIVRNAEYVSVKIEAAHVSYKSGFLENIKQIVVSSNVGFDLGSQKVQSLNVDRTWQKSNKSDDDIPVNDLLAVLSPASANSVSIKMSFSGIGQDRFKSVFDALSSTDVKTALNLSPATIAQSSLATSIVQKFLASPYTSANPRDVLSMSQGFVIYPDSDVDRVDALRQGYVVVISGQENKSADLNKLLSLGDNSLKFDIGSHQLQVKQADGSWQHLTGNSYVVLSVTVDSVRGMDEGSAWFKKFSDADKATETLLTGDAPDKVKKDALALWLEGSTLLSADADYVETERKQIRLKYMATIQEDMKKNGAPTAVADLSDSVPGLPSNLTDQAKNYDAQVQKANLGGAVTIRVLDNSGKAVPGAPVKLQDTVTGKTVGVTTDSSGTAVVGSVKPGKYSVEATIPGFAKTEIDSVDIKPRSHEELNLPTSLGGETAATKPPKVD